MGFRNIFVLLEHVFKHCEEVLALNPARHDNQGVNVRARAVNAETERAKGKDLAACFFGSLWGHVACMANSLHELLDEGIQSA